jgi:hypothetical protein
MKVFKEGTEEFCAYCGWPRVMHESKEIISDNRKGNHDYSFDDCPGFELEPQ